MYYRIIDKETGKTLAEDSSSHYAMRRAIDRRHEEDGGLFGDSRFLSDFCTFEDEVYTLEAGKHYHCSFPLSIYNYPKIVHNLLQQYFICIMTDPGFHDLRIEIVEG
jgi:hypothetical protein